MTLRVLGIDPSMTATGVASLAVSFSHRSPEFGLPLLHTFKTTGTAHDGHRETCERMRSQRTEVAELAGDADLVVLEGLSHASKGSSTRDLAGLWWLLYERLSRHDAPVGVCPPTVRAKWATGKGSAGKAVVGVAMGRRWPDADIGDDNQADALALASMGLQVAECLPWSAPQYQTDTLGKIAWPDGQPELF